MAQAGNSSLFTPYDGTGDVKEFVKRFYWYAASCGWDDNTKKEMLPYVLKGKAERCFNGFTNDQKATIAEALQALTTACSQSQETLLEAFNDRKPTLR